MLSWLFRSRDPRKQTGGAGEDAVAAFWTDRGARLLSRNFRCAVGEIDLVVEDGGTVVFVEVKSASAPGGPEPELRVGAAKRRKLTRLAEFYLSHKRLHGRPARFDVLAVTFDPAGGPPRIVHYPDAFPAER